MSKKLKYLFVEANVRYWEDATINGLEDVNGTIPFREGDLWKPVINLEEGEIEDWPQGMTARIYYKVCDAGKYFLADEDKNIVFEYIDDYVPDTFLCFGDRGYGDYIIMEIDDSGKIKEYRKPEFDPDLWKGYEAIGEWDIV